MKLSEAYMALVVVGMGRMGDARAFLPIRQYQPATITITQCPHPQTVTVTQYITRAPDEVTIALQGPPQISSSLASAISVDIIAASDESMLAPVVPTTVTQTLPHTTQELTYTEKVPVIQATHTSVSGSESVSVWFVEESDASLFNGISAPDTAILGTTTVTLSGTSVTTAIKAVTTGSGRGPFPGNTGGIFTGPNISAGWNATMHSAGPTGTGSVAQNSTSTVTLTSTTFVFVLPNSTASSSEGGARPISSSMSNSTATSLGSGDHSLSSFMHNSSTTSIGYEASAFSTPMPNSTASSLITGAYAATTAMDKSATSTSSVDTYYPTTGYNTNVTYGYPPYSYQERDVKPKEKKRQVCTEVSAIMYGKIATWCNNWDGSSVIWHKTYTSTYIPTPVEYPAMTSTELTSSTSVAATSYPSPTLSTSTIASFSPSRGSNMTFTIETSPPTPSSSIASIPTSFSNSTMTNSTSATSTSCGQTGDFVISFDDLPPWDPPTNAADQFPPIFNPYDHFYWSDGWSYVPPPKEPYPPQAGDQLAEFIPPSNTGKAITAVGPAAVPDASFGAGPRSANNIYWFNAQSAYVGCDNGNHDVAVTCDFVVTGWKWDATQQKEVEAVVNHYPQPPCPGFTNCHLNQIFFNSSFSELSSMSFAAMLNGNERIFFVDTIALSWWNNTCEAGVARSSAKRI